MSSNPSPTDDLELDEILRSLILVTHEGRPKALTESLDSVKAALTAREARKVAEVEKAYGGCHNCQLCEVHRDGME